MPKSCVAVNCLNHNYMIEKNLTFHIFAKKERFKERWEKWVQACKRVNADGSKWEPKGRDVFISAQNILLQVSVIYIKLFVLLKYFDQQLYRRTG